MKPKQRRAWAFALALGGGLFVNVGCDDTPLGPPVPDEPSESVLTDFRSDLVVAPAGFSLVDPNFVGDIGAVRTDQTSGWDYLFSTRADGVSELFPRDAVLDDDSSAGLQKVTIPFEAVTTAPEDGYITDQPIPVEVGDVLVGVSRAGCEPGTLLRRFAKFEILEIDPLNQTLRLQWLANPNCENRTLVPGAAPT